MHPEIRKFSNEESQVSQLPHPTLAMQGPELHPPRPTVLHFNTSTLEGTTCPATQRKIVK
jgi:hypothetical protein